MAIIQLLWCYVKKLVYGVQNQLSSASETVPCISVEDIDSNLYGRPESRRFQTENIKIWISFSFCIFLLAIVLSFWYYGRCKS